MSIYLLDKQSGVTSNKALSFVKRELNVKKAGFSGVLDPFATGLLIIGTNADTKFLELFLNSPKTYTGTILFGRTTDTLDIDGQVISEIDNVVINEDKLREVINEKFIGNIEQVPPKFSNIKVDGKRAHELSRKDVEFELKPVSRTIYSFEIEKMSDSEYKFKVVVSSGTYIRSLARDIGNEFELPAMLTSLRRESIGEINVPKNEMEEVSRESIVPLKFIEVENSIIKDLLDGKKVKIESSEKELIVRDQEDRYIWVVKDENSNYKINKNII